MGFDLASMIADLEELITLETEPSEHMKEISERLAWWKKYAEECGRL